MPGHPPGPDPRLPRISTESIQPSSYRTQSIIQSAVANQGNARNVGFLNFMSSKGLPSDIPMLPLLSKTAKTLKVKVPIDINEREYKLKKTFKPRGTKEPGQSRDTREPDQRRFKSHKTRNASQGKIHRLSLCHKT